MGDTKIDVIYKNFLTFRSFQGQRSCCSCVIFSHSFFPIVYIYSHVISLDGISQNITRRHKRHSGTALIVLRWPEDSSIRPLYKRADLTKLNATPRTSVETPIILHPPRGRPCSYFLSPFDFSIFSTSSCAGVFITSTSTAGSSTAPSVARMPSKPSPNMLFCAIAPGSSPSAFRSSASCAWYRGEFITRQRRRQPVGPRLRIRADFEPVRYASRPPTLSIVPSL